MSDLKKKARRCAALLLFFTILFLWCCLTDFECVYLRRYHPMVFSLPLVAAYIALDGHVFRNKTLNTAVISLIGAGFAVNYAIKLAA